LLAISPTPACEDICRAESMTPSPGLSRRRPVVYLIQWAICRGSAKPLFALRAIDSTTTVLVAFFHSLMVFSGIAGELPGLSYARALLLVTFGLLIRAIPQSARALVDLLDGCHDGEPWTDEMGRAWWRRYSPDVLAHLRHHGAAAPQNLATFRSSSQRGTTAMVRSPRVVGVPSSRRQR
jgi:hypothetical protein